MLTTLTTDFLIALHSHAGSLPDTVLVRRLLSTLTHTRSSRTTVRKAAMTMRSRDATTPPAEPATQEHARADTRTADVTMDMDMDMNMIHAHTETANTLAAVDMELNMIHAHTETANTQAVVDMIHAHTETANT